MSSLAGRPVLKARCAAEGAGCGRHGGRQQAEMEPTLPPQRTRAEMGAGVSRCACR